MSDRKVVEGVWDCSACQTKGIRGRNRECPNCGRPRGNDVRFYVQDTSNVSYVENAETVSKNPDWFCKYCDTLNSDKNIVCEGCGASREDSDTNYFTMQQPAPQPVPQPTPVRTAGNTNTKKKKKSIIPFILAVLAVFFVIFLVTRPKQDTLSVETVYWESMVTIEEQYTVRESDWSVPSGGRVYDQREELHSYASVFSHNEYVEVEKSKQVIVGYNTEYKDLGNGYFEEVQGSPIYETEYYTVTEERPVYNKVPVYKTKYYYEIDKWQQADTLEATGTDKKPYYNEPVLQEKERFGNRSVEYYITAMNDDGKKETYEITKTEWELIEVGDSITVMVHSFDEIEVLEIIKPNGKVHQLGQ